MTEKTKARKKLIKELDRVFSLYIRKRDGRCVVCGKTENLQCGHLFSRVAYSTRWDVGNCFAQCSGCNLRHEHDAWPFQRWYIKKFGQDHLEALHQRYRSIRKYKDAELAELIDQFKHMEETLA